MRLRARARRALIAGALVLLAGATPVRATAAPVDEPQVGHALSATRGAGARIVDDLGRTVILRGVNVNGLGAYYQALPDLPSTVPLTEDDFVQMADLGFDVVRLIVSWSELEPQPGAIDSAYLDRIEQTIGWARAHDIYVLLDMHQDAWSPFVFTPDGVTCPPPLEPAIGWDGAPAWATALSGTAATCKVALREASLAVATSFQSFYLDVNGVQGHLVSTWAHVAGRFASDPTVAGYDLLNEPNPGLVAGVDDYALLGSFYDRTLTAIRASEAAAGGFTHIGFFEPSVITGPLSVPGPLAGFSADADLVYAPHLYNESISILPGTIEQGFANAATAANAYGTTFFSGEWGWFGDPASDQALIERYAANEDANLVGGTWWQWKQACGDPHSIGSPGHRPGCADTSPYSDGIVVRSRENTMVLDRAYPRAAPGTLTSIDADVASGGLVVTGDADRDGTAADLWVPARCGTPNLTGTNIGDGTIVPSGGGARVSVPVQTAGRYRIAITCAGQPDGGAAADVAPSHSTSSLPATGDREGTRLPVALALLALALAVAALRRRAVA